MPIFHFSTYDYELYHGATFLPPDLSAALDEVEVVGKIYRWGDKAIILVDVVNNNEWYFVPAECIALDR